MPIIHFKNIKVNYSIIGKGKPIVLLHGFLENTSMWNNLASSLSNRHQVICIDLLGHGETQNLGYIHTMEEQAEMVENVLGQLNLPKCVLIGHSMGGYVSLAFAELFPDKVNGICLLNSTALADDEEKQISRNRAIKAVKKFPDTFVRLAIPNLFSEENKSKFKITINEITEEALKMTQQGIIAALEGMKIRKDRTDLLSTSNFPILIIMSKKDPALDFQSLLDQVEGTPVKKHILPDGHMSHFENKKEIDTVITRFIETCYQ